MDHVLWTDDFRILIKHMTEFWPDNKYSSNRKINSSVRYILYSSLLLTYLYKNLNFLVVGIILSLCITFILKNCSSSYDPKQLFIKLYKSELGSVNKPKKEKAKECKPQTLNNPAMNNIPFDKSYTKPCDNIEKSVNMPFDAYENNEYDNLYTIPTQNFEDYKNFITEDVQNMKGNNYPPRM